MAETSELALLRDSARGALSKFPDALGLSHGDVIAPAVVADAMATAADQGWLAALLPEDLGGLSLGMREAVLIAEEVGRALAPGPYLAGAVLVPILASVSGSQQFKDLAGRVAAGEASVAVSVVDEGDGPNARRLVEHGATADLVIAMAISGAPAHPTLKVEQVGAPEWQQLRPFDPACPIAEMVGSGRPSGGAVYLDETETAQVLGAAQLWIAGELLGSAERAGRLSIEYAGTRKQFGAFIGANQAIKHRIVDDYVLRQNATAIVEEAAQAWDAGRDDRHLLAHAARAAATSAALASTAHCIQVHGAVGFSAESTIHLAYKRVRRLACTLGSEARSRAFIANRLVSELTA